MFRAFVFGIVAMVLSLTANAGVRVFNSSGVDLGTTDNVQCVSGMTCTRTGTRVLMASSPTNPLTLLAADTTDAILTMSADNAVDNGDTWQMRSVASGNAFTLSNDASGSQVAKVTVSASAGNVTGPGTGFIAGFKKQLVAATATTITAAQCGSVFYNSGAVEINLPEASTVLGCVLTFVTLNAANFDVNPDNADQILGLTNAAGDKIRNATIGNTVTLMAVSASQWVDVASYGTWIDAD